METLMPPAKAFHTTRAANSHKAKLEVRPFPARGAVPLRKYPKTNV